MRWWPRKERPRAPDAAFLPAPVKSPSALPGPTEVPQEPAPQSAFQRPDTVIGLLSDLSRNPGEAETFLVIARGLMRTVTVYLVIGASCVFVVTHALKGIKVEGSTLRTALPYGMAAAASFLAYLVNRAWRWMRKKFGKAAKTGRTDPAES